MADIQPIGGGYTQGMAGQGQDVRQMAKQLKTHIDQFKEQLPPNPEHLDDLSKAIQHLNSSSMKALDMTKNPTNRLMEDVQNSAQTAQVILSQPLSVEGASENVSLISAATSYKEEDGKDSDLYKISLAFSQYPEQTTSLKNELILTSKDLTP